ncbi:hypothetical protein [Leucobacter sp. wl10]|uniref:hypothetical protein n=1 Tax=Leucobacter sp. wl10 TaxID=2304677 RepID=UPI000E5BAF47|nr:hypothetical protein [Leucobacter sp. wl10]RGE20515.1 hypothetical protein D1J51_08815 [Leucobacter sp. wl10]
MVAMRVGWVPALLLVTTLAVAVIRILRREGASVANVAVAGQIPGLLAVAFITQYSVFFWFSTGLAVAIGVASRHRRERPLGGTVGTLAHRVGAPPADALIRLSGRGHRTALGGST